MGGVPVGDFEVDDVYGFDAAGAEGLVVVVDGGGGVDEGGAPAATLLTAIVTEDVLLESVTLVAVSVAFPVFALAV